MNAFNLVVFNIAVDVVDGRIDKKDIFKHLKQQLPKESRKFWKSILSGTGVALH